jgi:tRNA A37 methylthiotransferase MiaB
MPDQVPESIKSERSAKLISLQNEITNKILSRQIDNVYDVLFETQNKDFAVGHTPSFIEIQVNSDRPLQGNTHPVRIVGVEDGVCLGKLITSENEEVER